MKKLLALLETKNRCLARFAQVSQGFADAIAAGDWGGMGEFNRERESILKALDLFDRKVDEAIVGLRPEDKTEALLASVRELVEQKDREIERIFRIDAVIIQSIEAEKAQIGENVGVARRGKSAIGKFKSGMSQPPGSSFEGEV